MLIKDNVTIGINWRFGPGWPWQRCGAKTRRSTTCQLPANKKNGRCGLHGGASTGAKTEEGLARISAASLRHGKFTKDKLEKLKAKAAKRAAEASPHSPYIFPRYCNDKGCKTNSAGAELNKWLKQSIGDGYVMHSVRHAMRDSLRAVICPSE